MRRLVFAAFALTVFAACGPAPSDDDSSQVPMSPQAAVSAVRQVYQKYADDWNAGNVDAVLAILADDVVHMTPAGVQVGKEELSADWRAYFEEYTDFWEPTIDQIQAAGNLVFIQVQFTATETPKAGGHTNTNQQKGVTVFRCDASGTWRLVLEQWFDVESG